MCSAECQQLHTVQWTSTLAKSARSVRTGYMFSVNLAIVAVHGIIIEVYAYWHDRWEVGSYLQYKIHVLHVHVLLLPYL